MDMPVGENMLLGKKFWMPDDECIAPYVRRFGVWEPMNTRIISSYLSVHRAGMFVDVGANSGYFSILAAEVLGSRGRVRAYEPQPGLYACLRKNIDERNLSNIESFQMAVGESNRTGQLMTHRINGGDHRLVPDEVASRDNEWDFVDPVVDVSVITLDSHLLSREQPLFVKIDTQGYELRVLRGAGSVIDQADERFALLCEWTPKMMVSNGDDPEALLEWMEQHQLHMSVVDHRRGCVYEFMRGDFPSAPEWPDLAVDLLCTKGAVRTGFLDVHFPTCENAIAQRAELSSQLEHAEQRCSELELEMQTIVEARDAALETLAALREQLTVTRVNLPNVERANSNSTD